MEWKQKAEFYEKTEAVRKLSYLSSTGKQGKHLFGVFIKGVETGVGQGSSKQAAEELAAAEALQKLAK